MLASKHLVKRQAGHQFRLALSTEQDPLPAKNINIIKGNYLSLKKVIITDASIGDSLSNAPLEKTGAAVAAVHAIVLPVRLVPANLAQNRNRKCSTHH